MPLETASHIASLNATNPASGDAVAQADDHLRLIKSVLTTDFATINAPITATPTEINSLGGILKTQLDRAGSLTTAGTATAYTLTSNTVFASLSAMNGKAVIFKPHVTSGASPTLNVDGLGAIALKSIAGTAIPTGALLIGGRYAVTYNDSATEFVVHGIFGVLPATSFSGAVTVQAGGVNVTGASTFNDLAAFSGGSGAPVSFSWNDAGALAGPTLDLYRDSASPAASDGLGTIDINGRDSANNKQLYVRYGGLISSPTSTTETGSFYIQTVVAGAFTTVLQSSGADIAIPGNLVVTGNLVINTNKFTVDAATGNTVAAGTLGVTGAVFGSAAILSSSATAGVGYATGAGGTVTQATSKSTAVTLNKAVGAITMNAAALGSGNVVSFVLTNSAIAATDMLVLNHISGGTAGNYLLNAQCSSGAAGITVRNVSVGALSEAIVIQFAVIKGVNA